MSVLNFLVEKNFNKSDFEFNKKNRKISIKKTPVVKFSLIENSDALIDEEQSQREMVLTTWGKLGILNLSFTPSSSEQIKLCDLPDNAPLATTMLIQQTYTGGLVWLDMASREVIGSGLQAGAKVVITMAGFFD